VIGVCDIMNSILVLFAAKRYYNLTQLSHFPDVHGVHVNVCIFIKRAKNSQTYLIVMQISVCQFWSDSIVQKGVSFID